MPHKFSGKEAEKRGGGGLRVDGSGGGPLEGDAFGAVFDADDAATAEAVFGEEVEQHGVVPVGVGTEVGPAVHAPAEAVVGDAPGAAVGGHAVEGDVGEVVEPRAVLDDAVVGLLALGGNEGGCGVSRVVHDDVGLTGGDVLKGSLAGRVAVDPLGGVAGGAHEGPCAVEYVHHCVDVRYCRFPDFHGIRMITLQTYIKNGNFSVCLWGRKSSVYGKG